MNENRNFYNQPIRSLQWMLRIIAQEQEDIEPLIPNGIYEPLTQAAVSKFQRNHGLPVTGVTDRATWDSIVSVYDEAIVNISPAQPIAPDPQVKFPITQGPLLALAQTMLFFLAQEYHSVFSPGHSGILDEMTRHALSDFQALSALPMTGILDKKTWKMLSLQFSAITAR